MAVAGRLQPGGAVVKKDHAVYLMLLTGLRKGYRGNRGCSRRVEPNMKQAVGIEIDSGVQPVLPIIELNRCFIGCNVIRASTVCRL